MKTCRRSPSALEWLLPVQDVARTVGFRVPAFVRGASGALLVDGWTCETFMPGHHRTMSDFSKLQPALMAFHDQLRDVQQRPGFAGAAGLLAGHQCADADLAALPEHIREACLAAFRPWADESRTAIHGDLSVGNVVWDDGGNPALVDWDESRIDWPMFDLGATADGKEGQFALAHLAWEVACSWSMEPDYAKRMASTLLARQ